MHTNFIELSATLRNKYLLKTDALFVAQQQRWFVAFAEHFQTICAEIVKLQNELSLSAILRIEYTMLYSNFTNQRYIAEVWLYGDDIFLDKNQRLIGMYDISFLLALLRTCKRQTERSVSNETIHTEKHSR